MKLEISGSSSTTRIFMSAVCKRLMSVFSCAILAAMEDAAKAGIGQRAGELARAIESRDLDAVRRLCTPEHWERSGGDEYRELLPEVERVELLGVLGRRDLIRLETPGGRYERSVFEHLWHDGTPPLVDDQRQFTVI